jgi:hypothetical protein
MKSHVDHILIRHALDKVGNRLTIEARRLLDHETTGLSFSLYKRGSWMFYCKHEQAHIAVKQAPTGTSADVMLHYRSGQPSVTGVQE